MPRDQWLGIELRHLAALEAIAQERSFRGAASRLGYVQSAISRQVAVLEQLTGTRLIERSQGPRPVHLTEAGELLLQHTEDILASLGAAKSDFDRLSRGGCSEVNLGVFPGIPARVLPAALTMMSRRRPDLLVLPTEAANDSGFFELLKVGRIDLAFTCLPVEPGPFDSCELLRVPWALAVREGDEPRSDRPPTASDVTRTPLIGVGSPRLGPAIEARLRAEGGSPRVVFRSDVAETAHALAAAGIGAAIVPRLAVNGCEPRTTLVDLGHLLPPLTIGLAWHRGRRLPPAVGELREVLTQVCAAPTGVRRFERALGIDAAIALDGAVSSEAE